MNNDGDITIGSASLAAVFSKLDLSSDARAEVTRIDAALAAELQLVDVDPEAVAALVFQAAEVVAADADNVSDVLNDDGDDWWHFDVDAADKA